MFCPFCGDVLVAKRDARWGESVCCVRGKMELSEHMRQTLEQRYGGVSVEDKPRSVTSTSGRQLGHWFCPGCGVPLNAQMQCPTCGKSLRDQLFGLVELHPHAYAQPGGQPPE